MSDETTCSKCKSNPAREPHGCPFAEDIHGDYGTKCDCCEECEDNCAMEI